MAQGTDRALYLVVARRSEDGSFGSSNDGALYRSTDSAAHWTKITLPSGLNGPNGIAMLVERIEEQGGDPFNEYLVPLAALKLKQGFGRLIRSRTDVGVVVLLDRRVTSKRYGAALLAGLPPASRSTGPWAVLREEMAEFFALHGIGEREDVIGDR